MNLDDQLRSASNDVRSEIDRLPTPAFEPPSPTGARIAIIAAIGLLAGGSWWLTRPSDDGEVITTPVADESNESDDAPLDDATPDGAAVDAGGIDLVVHADEIPTSDMAPPPIDAPVIEPDFGTPIRRITNGNAGEVIQPVFAATQTFNVDGALALLYRTGSGGSGHVVVDTTSGAEVARLDLVGRSDIENVAWDATDPDHLRFQRENQIVKLDVRTGVEEVTTVDGCDRVDNGQSNRSTTSGTSRLGLVCHRTDGTMSWIVVDTATGDVIAERPTDVAEPPVALVSGEGFVVVDADRALHLDLQLEELSTISIEASSWTVAADSDGRDVLVATVFGGPTAVGTAVVVDLDSGGIRTVAGPDTDYPYPPSGTHLSTAATSQPNLVAIATNDEVGGVLANEIMLLRLDGDRSTLVRLAHHRSSLDDLGGWPGDAMVAISPDGSTVWFSSDWGGDAIDTYAIDLTGATDPTG